MVTQYWFCCRQCGDNPACSAGNEERDVSMVAHILQHDHTLPVKFTVWEETEHRTATVPQHRQTQRRVDEQL